MKCPRCGSHHIGNAFHRLHGAMCKTCGLTGTTELTTVMVFVPDNLPRSPIPFLPTTKDGWGQPYCGPFPPEMAWCHSFQSAAYSIAAARTTGPAMGWGIHPVQSYEELRSYLLFGYPIVYQSDSWQDQWQQSPKPLWLQENYVYTRQWGDWPSIFFSDPNTGDCIEHGPIPVPETDEAIGTVPKQEGEDEGSDPKPKAKSFREIWSEFIERSKVPPRVIEGEAGDGEAGSGEPTS